MAKSFCRAARCRAVMPRGPCAAASQAMPRLMPHVRSRSTCSKDIPLRLITHGTAYGKALIAHRTCKHGRPLAAGELRTHP